MKKHSNILWGALCTSTVLLATIGCSQDQWEGDASLAMRGGVTLSASFENSGSTRTAINAQNQIVWSKDDAFKFFYTQSSEAKSAKFVAAAADNTSNSAEFSSTDLSSFDGVIPNYAVFPYDEATSINEATVTMTLPATYTKQADASQNNYPMYAHITDVTSPVQFRHLAAVMKLSISSSVPTSAAKLVVTADKPISGSFTATLSETNPVLAAATDNSSDDNKTVTITFTLSDATTGTTDFFVPIPVGTYGKITAQLQDASEKALYAAKEWTNVNVTRAALMTSTFGFTTLEAGTENLNDAIAKALPKEDAEIPASGVTTNLEISGTIDATTGDDITPLELPVVANSNINLSLSAVPTTSSDKPLTIQAANLETTSTPAAAVNEVALVIPEVANGESTTAPYVDIQMPTTTVSLKAADEAKGTTFAQVTAMTATNTLVVGNAVTINKLIVKGGNIKLNGSAKITDLSKAEDAPAVVYIIKASDTATLPDALPEGFQVVDAESEIALRAAAAEGGTVTMTEDVTLSSPLVVASTMTLDLNGHTLKAADAGLTQVLNTKDAVVLVRRGADLTIQDSSSAKNGSIQSGNAESVYAAVKLTDKDDETGSNSSAEAKLTVTGGNLTGYYYAIVGNGTRHGTTINVNGGVMTSLQGAGIYHPQDGTLTISGGEITGVDTAVELRSGTLNLTGGTLKCTATEFSKAPNGNGTTIVGAALAVSQHTTNKNINVSISGGTLEGIYALYEEDLQDDSHANITLSETGTCTFNGKVYSQNNPKFVASGTYSDESALHFLADNASIAFSKDVEVLTTPHISGTAVIDLQQHTLTVAATAIETISGEKYKMALCVDDSGMLTLKNGALNNSWYGVYAKGKAKVTLESMDFGENVTYAYNGAGTLTATDCVFHGWLSGWHNGGTFSNCIFTIGKKWYPANICYGNTTYTNCKFFKNGTDADAYDATGNAPDADGYYRCNYIVAACNPTTTVGFTTCKFIDASNAETDLTVADHPYHGCGWGDGKVADANITVDGAVITTQCLDCTKASSETVTE